MRILHGSRRKSFQQRPAYLMRTAPGNKTNEKYLTAHLSSCIEEIQRTRNRKILFPPDVANEPISGLSYRKQSCHRSKCNIKH